MSIVTIWDEAFYQLHLKLKKCIICNKNVNWEGSFRVCCGVGYRFNKHALLKEVRLVSYEPVTADAVKFIYTKLLNPSANQKYYKKTGIRVIIPDGFKYVTDKYDFMDL